VEAESGSRVCAAYSAIRSPAVGRSVQRVSTVLGALYLAKVVRYDTGGKRNRCRLKHLREDPSVLTSFSELCEGHFVGGHHDT
jgi:hypothetical protein